MSVPVLLVLCNKCSMSVPVLLVLCNKCSMSVPVLLVLCNNMSFVAYFQIPFHHLHGHQLPELIPIIVAKLSSIMEMKVLKALFIIIWQL